METINTEWGIVAFNFITKQWIKYTVCEKPLYKAVQVVQIPPQVACWWKPLGVTKEILGSQEFETPFYVYTKTHKVAALVQVWIPEYNSKQGFLNCDPVSIDVYPHQKENISRFKNFTKLQYLRVTL